MRKTLGGVQRGGASFSGQLNWGSALGEMMVAYLYVGLLLVAPVILVVAAALHFKSMRTKLSASLLVGAVGQLVTGVLFRVAELTPRIEMGTPIYAILNVMGLVFGFLFSISLLLVLRDRIGTPSAQPAHGEVVSIEEREPT